MRKDKLVNTFHDLWDAHWNCISRSVQVSAFVQRIRLRGKPFVANGLGIEETRGTKGRASVLLPRIRVRNQLASPSCLIWFTRENVGWRDLAGQLAAINTSQVLYYHLIYSQSLWTEGISKFARSSLNILAFLTTTSAVRFVTVLYFYKYKVKTVRWAAAILNKQENGFLSRHTSNRPNSKTIFNANMQKPSQTACLWAY